MACTKSGLAFRPPKTLLAVIHLQIADDKRCVAADVERVQVLAYVQEF